MIMEASVDPQPWGSDWMPITQKRTHKGVLFARLISLKRHGFRVVRAKIEDATGKCPGVRWSAVLRGRAVDYNKTLVKVIAARDAEIARRGDGEITRDSG
jgi:hypothetical protein